MANKQDQDQHVAENAVAIQAGGNVNFNGVNAVEVIKIFNLLFAQNFIQATERANTLAVQRAEEVSRKIFEEFMNRNPEGLKQAEDPGFQSDLFNIQQAYAKTGDVGLATMLSDLLVERSKSNGRDIKQIVLSEAMTTAPKLSMGQINALTLVFLVRRTVNNGAQNFPLFMAYLQTRLLPLLATISATVTTFEHLEYAGCGAIELGSIELGEAFRQTYGRIFTRGINSMQSELISNNGNADILEPHPETKDVFQIRFNDKETLKTYLLAKNTPEAETNSLLSIFEDSLLQSADVRAKIVAAFPDAARLFDIWEKTHLKSFKLTSVGIALAHSNWERVTGDRADLGIWIVG